METQTSSLDHYRVLRTIGAGTFGKVKLGQDKGTGQLVALKILKQASQSHQALALAQSFTEIQALSQLSHPHILRLIGYNQQGVYVSRTKGTLTRLYIATELAPYGDLIDVLTYCDQFNEEVIRTMFKQLISAVYTAHKAGISHRDIKPENVLLDAQFHLCLGDFGWAGPLLGRDGSGYLRTRAGTEEYMAPELLQGLPYRGTAVDVFACGMLLFIMAMRIPPFSKADIRDQRYVCFVDRNDLFWEKFDGKIRVLTSELKTLINGMLNPDPSRRLRIEEIWVHPWLNQAELDPASFATAMQSAYARSRQRMVQVPPRRTVGNGGTEYRANLGESRDCEGAVLEKQPTAYTTSTVLYTGMTADNCASIIRAVLVQHRAEVSAVEGKYKLKAVFPEESHVTREQQFDGLLVSVELFAREDGLIAAEVRKQKGDRFGLQMLFSLLESELKTAAVS